ncbi:MAG: hypothetical protein ACRDPI_02490, partial [Nocardioidaceae bacterium]
MRERPPHVTDDELLEAVRRDWGPVDRLEHLPIGFGAHHWKATTDGRPTLFVTFDGLLPKRDAAGLEAAYASAVELDLPFVLACVPSAAGGFTRPLADGAVSVTPWVDGRSGDGTFASRDDAGATAAMLSTLHAAEPPSGIPHWRPLVQPGFRDELAPRLVERWDTGPYGETVRTALVKRLDDIGRWATRYAVLSERARARRANWVATHGEPDTSNQLVDGDRRWLLDWESLRLAPRERDLRTLIDGGWADLAGDPDPAMVELFDLE